MNKLSLTVVATVSLYIFAGCGSKADNDGLDHHHHGHEHEQHDSHDDHDSHEEADVIHLSVEQADKFGIKTEKTEIKDFDRVIEVSGEVLPSPTDRSAVVAPSSGIVRFYNGIMTGKNVNAGEAVAAISAKNMVGGDANENARITLEAAKRELDRVTPLHAEGIVSTKEFNAIEENYRRAKAAYSGSAAGSVAKCVRGGVISELSVSDGEYVEAGTPIAYVSTNQRLTLRADLPEKYLSEIQNISSANIKLPSKVDVLSLSQLNGKRVTASPREINGGYIPVYFTFDNDGTILSGSFAEVFLIGKGDKKSVSVPISALAEQQGERFVFVRLDEDCYRKVPVEAGASDGRRVEIKSGLGEDEDVVVEGVTFVKLAATSGVVPEGHSHNH